MRKKILKIQLSVSAMLMLAACSNDDFTSFIGAETNNTNSGTVSGGSLSAAEIGTTDIATFDIALNTTALANETEVTDASNEDFVEEMLAAESDGIKTLTVTYDGTTATWTYTNKKGNVVTPDASDLTVSADGAHVTINAYKKIRYVLQGSATDGCFKIYSDKKFIIDLNGVTLANKTGAAINIQKGTDGDKRCYLRVIDGTVNTLSDGTTYSTPDSEDEKGVIFSEGKLLVSGSGSLVINGKGKNGLASDDYIYLHAGTNTMITPASGYDGIKANEGIYIAGGVHNITCSGNAPKGLTCDSLVSITGGRTTIINNGVAVYDSEEQDYSQPAGVKCDSAIVVSGGELYCKSTGNGGKGIRAGLLYTQNGGTVKIITTGSSVGSSQSNFMRPGGNTSSSGSDAEAKGLHVGKKSDTSGLITINGGQLTVRCTGGEGSEGIESKNKIIINDGIVESYCYDDAINAKTNITINGGYVYGNGTNNDGIDSNGTLTINGGVVLACGTTTPEDGFDCDQNTFAINGGILVGIGGDSSTPTSSVCKQASVLTNISLSGGSVVALQKSDGTAVTAFKVPARYNGSYKVLLSTPGIITGNTYSFLTGATIGGKSFQGIVFDELAVSGGSASWSYTQSSLVTGSTSGGMGGRPF
ncbi:MAG: carbohydrate-binding domain-containing protein [Prevotella sp.]|nr:carbohydrate-binding domain-containing protein [Prevotella sp.]